MGNLTVAIKNPPPDATLWSLKLCDWNITTLLHFSGWDGKYYLDIGEKATFEVPGGLALPLRVVELQICKWNADRTALIELYYVQSYQPPSKAAVSVSLKNPPSGANGWGLSLWDGATHDSKDPSSYSGYGINQVLNFTIPARWTWPLRFRIIIAQVFADGTVIYMVLRQSVTPEWTGEGWQYVQEYLHQGGDNFYNVATGKFEHKGPYREVFIPETGEYYYNVTTGQFEQIAPPAPEFSGFAIADYSKV